MIYTHNNKYGNNWHSRIWGRNHFQLKTLLFKNPNIFVIRNNKEKKLFHFEKKIAYTILEVFKKKYL